MRPPLFNAWTLSWAALIWARKETVDSWAIAMVKAMVGGWRTEAQA